jgi:PAS domain S-box-containing protein
MVDVVSAARSFMTPVGHDAHAAPGGSRRATVQWLIVLCGGLVTIAVTVGMVLSDRRSVARSVDAMADNVQRAAIAAGNSRFHELDRMAHRRERLTYTSPVLWGLDAAQYLLDVPDYQGLLWVDSNGVVPMAAWRHVRRFREAERSWAVACERVTDGHVDPDTGMGGRVRATEFRRGADGIGFAGCAPLARPGSTTPVGWIVGIFELRGFLNGIMTRSGSAGYRVVIADSASHVELRNDVQSPLADARWTAMRPVHIAGRTWEMTVTPTAARIEAMTSHWPLVVFAAGLMTSILMALIARLSAVAQRATRGRARAEFALDDIVESAADAIESTTPDGRVTYVNAAWRALFCDRSRALPGGAAESQLAEGWRDAYAAYRADLLSGAGGEAFEGVFTDLDGARHVLAIRSSVRRVDGVPTAVRSVLRDVTQQRAVEDERARLSAVLDATPDFVGVAGGNGRAIYINRAGRRMLGIPPDADVTGIGLTAVYPPDARAHQIAVAIPTALRDGAWSGDTTVMAAGGQVIPVSQVVISHESPRGGERFVSTIMRDRSAQVQREDELRMLQRATVAIADAADTTEAYRVAVRELCALTGWPYGEAWVMGDYGLGYATVWHDESAGLQQFAEASAGKRFPIGTGLAGAVWAAKEAIWVREIGSDRHYARVSGATAAGLGAAIGVPVLAGDEIVGVLLFHLRVTSVEDDRRAKLVTVVAAQLGRQILQKRAEHELRDSEERNRRLSDASTDGIVISRDGLLLEANAAFRRLFLLGEHVAGFPGIDLFVPADRARAEASIAAHESGGYEATAMRLDGTTFEASIRAHEVPYPGGVARLAVVRDITEWKELDRLKNEFVSTVSHELRTPLTSLRGSLGLLEGGHGGALTSKGCELVQIARSNTDRLIRLINDMLDLDKMAAGRLELQRVPLNAAVIVRTVGAAADRDRRIRGRSGDDARRPRSDRPGADEPPLQRDQVLAPLLDGHDPRVGGSRRRREQSGGQWGARGRGVGGRRAGRWRRGPRADRDLEPGPWHPAGRRRAAVHAVPAARRLGWTAQRRHRSGPGDLQGDHRPARRHDRRLVRAGGRDDVLVRAAGGGRR